VSTHIPAHSHPAYATQAAATSGAPGPGVLPGAVSGQTMYVTDTSGGRDFGLAPQVGGIAGGGWPHANTMPTLVMNYCIALEGIFPPRN
jgi:microcystin-dependent protein